LWLLNEAKPIAFATGEYPAYSALVPAEQHIVGKAFTHNIEAKNTFIRRKLARFHRKTKAHPKSIAQTYAALNLLLKN